jgi:hypothetical protein
MLQSQAPKTPYKVFNRKGLRNFLSEKVYKFDKEIPYCMDYTSVGQLFQPLLGGSHFVRTLGSGFWGKF